MPTALLRIALSRGVGIRGYSPKSANHPSLVMSLHTAPPLDPEPPLRWRLTTSSLRLLANDPLAQFKTCNKLPHIMARTDAEEAGAGETALIHNEGFGAPGASRKIFLLDSTR